MVFVMNYFFTNFRVKSDFFFFVNLNKSTAEAQFNSLNSLTENK